ncbi:MAG: hypothetical protein AAGJ90_21435, partial [Pseudomonadota bacterium]
QNSTLGGVAGKKGDQYAVVKTALTYFSLLHIENWEQSISIGRSFLFKSLRTLSLNLCPDLGIRSLNEDIRVE